MGRNGTRDYMFPDQETHSYLLKVPKEDWNDWLENIPQTIERYERLHALIQIDTALDGETDVASLNLLRMKLERIAQRCQTAEQALDDNDEQKARAELREIQSVIDGLQ